MRRSDPFAWLEGINPVPSTDDEATDAEVDDVVRMVADRARSEHRRRRRRVLVPAVAAVIVASASAWVWAAAVRHADDPTTIHCHAAVALTSDVLILSAPQDDPRAACEDAWSAVPDVQPPSPPFAVCVLDTGALGVFPQEDSRDPCGVLGLASAIATPSPTGQRVAEMQQSLSQRFGTSCVSLRDGEAAAAEALRSLELHDWSVESVDTTADACSSLAIDAQQRVVRIVPGPP